MVSTATASDAPDGWTWVSPIPADAPACPDKLTAGAETLFEYRCPADGKLSFLVARFPKKALKALPRTLWRDPAGGLEWRAKWPPARRSLFGAEKLAARPGAPVLVVSGEKTAIAAAGLFPGHVVVTWPMGDKAVATIDWTPLKGRIVVVWPDNDASGREAGARLPALLLNAGAASAEVVDLPAVLPEKWDLADAFPAGFDLAAARQLVAEAERRQPDVIWPRGFSMETGGLYWQAPDDGKEDARPPVWICGPMSVLGMVRDQENGNWGTAFEFSDHDGQRKQVIVPHADLAGEGIDVRRRFLSAGLGMRQDKHGRDRLMTALSSVRTHRRARLVYASGWAQPGAYVLPSGPIGTPGEAILYNGPVKASYHGQSGECGAWRDGVAAPAAGNAILVFALSCAFAAPLLRPMGGEGGGFHLKGGSSGGKTTALIVAGSVWGGGGNQGFVQTWRATPNAVESIAHAHNDGLLAFDEIKTLGGDAAGDAAYALATGQMKGRQNSNSDLRARLSWLVLILSSGELSFEDLLRTGRNRERAYAGQELRLVELSAEVTRVNEAWSAWQDIGSAQGHAQFADQLKTCALAHYGHAGPLFIERFIADREAMLKAANAVRRRFHEEVIEDGDTGQVRRGADRFALVAAAGELASLLDVTPWAPGEASAAAAFLFGRWAASFGRKHAREDLQAIRQIREFLQRYESTRFRPLKVGMSEEEALGAEAEAGERPRQNEARSLDVAGWKGVVAGKGMLYLFETEVWRTQIFNGLDPLTAARALKSAGFLVTDKDYKEGQRLKQRLTYTSRVPGAQPRNFYTVSSGILSADVSDE